MTTKPEVCPGCNGRRIKCVWSSRGTSVYQCTSCGKQWYIHPEK